MPKLHHLKDDQSLFNFNSLRSQIRKDQTKFDQQADQGNTAEDEKEGGSIANPGLVKWIRCRVAVKDRDIVRFLAHC